jgi:hypothetical protein
MHRCIECISKYLLQSNFHVFFRLKMFSKAEFLKEFENKIMFGFLVGLNYHTQVWPRGRKNREYLATFPSELHCERMHSSVANSWKGLPVNFGIQRRRFDIPTGTKCLLLLVHNQSPLTSYFLTFKFKIIIFV